MSLMNKIYLTTLDKKKMETIDLKQSDERTIEKIILEIKNRKSINVPTWENLKNEYNPMLHDIVTNTETRKDKKRKDGTFEKVARVTYGMQRLSARRMTQIGFSIPVKRIYKTGDDPEKKKQAEAIESIYSKARIDAVNIKRMKAYFASCEIVTVWFPVDEKNNYYGFDSNYKLKCITYSPMERRFSGLSTASIYPVFDRFEDLVAIAFEYKLKEENNDVTYFHVYTEEQEKIYTQKEGEWKDFIGEDSELSIKKIPCIYLWRSMPIWEDTTNNVNEIELSLSRESDILRKNSAPVLEVKGKLKGDAPTNEVSREVYQIEGDGGIKYVTWDQQVEALKFYTETLKKNIEEELQLPNLSFDNVKDISAITEGARKTLLTDAHLKVGDESGDILEFLSRECNVIKAFLGQMNTKWKNSINDLEVEHIITPFIQNDEGSAIDNITKATQKPVMSQKKGVELLGMVDDVEAEYNQLIEEEKTSNSFDVFEPAK